MRRQSVYLDHNATSPLRPEALAAMTHALETGGNASSVHAAGRAARRIMEDAREALAHAVMVTAEELIFTSGATEANNAALTVTDRPRVLISAIEHDASRAMPGVEAVPVDDQGIIRLDALDEMLAADDRPALVSVMLVNNETGIIQPVAEAGDIARKHKALLHCDAVQALGKIDVNLTDLGVDLASLSAHKLGGPPGIGALVARSHVPLKSWIVGGGQEKRRRAGTENLPGMAGFAAATTAAIAQMDAQTQTLAQMRDRIEASAREAGAQLFAQSVPRVTNTTVLGLPGLKAETQVMRMDLAGFCVSAGSACSSGKVTASHVLTAMG
ncbi:MAG: cysteine desulfurase family protein [Alphaproteobacteria bacterium]